MAITRTPIVNDDGSCTTGTVIDNAWKQEFYNQIDAAIGGVPVDVPFNAANFTAAAGVWTVIAGNQQTFRYSVFGKLVILVVSLTGTTTTASTATWNVALPPALTNIAKQVGAPFQYYSAGGTGTGLAQVDPGLPALRLLRDSAGTAWAPQSNLFVSVVLSFWLV